MKLCVAKDTADLSGMDSKSNKTIRMNSISILQTKPGLIFDKEKARVALMKSAYLVHAS